MNRMLASSFTVVCFLVAGCGGSHSLDSKITPIAGAALEKAASFELYSLDPNSQQAKQGERFHSWKVLGKTTVTDSATRRSLVRAFNDGVKNHDGRAAACFIPRHGIRAVHGGRTVDLVICFECCQVQVLVDGADAEHFLIGESPQPAFDDVLRAAGTNSPKRRSD